MTTTADRWHRQSDGEAGFGYNRPVPPHLTRRLARLNIALLGATLGAACAANRSVPAGTANGPAATATASMATQNQDQPASAALPIPDQPIRPAPSAPPATGDSVPEIPCGPGWSIITTAPEGLTAADLGRVFDASFQPLAGRKALFKTKEPERYPGFRHTVSLVEDGITLAATVKSWGLNADAARTRRFASYRAEQIADIHAVDDMTAPEVAPPSAMYYLAKVFYGRSFEVRLSGEEKHFNTGLAGVFLSGKLDGGMKSFAEKNRLDFTAVGRGLRPKSGTAIYAKQPAEIEDNYTVDGSVAVPIEVEYRLIPGRSLPTAQPIVWHKQSRYRVELSAVEAHNCDDTSACDLSVVISPADGAEKPKTYRGPSDTDLWEPRYLLLETTDEAELERALNVEVSDRNLTLSRLLGRCQVHIDQRRIRTVAESPDRRNRWTELCGKAQLRFTLTAEEN